MKSIYLTGYMGAGKTTIGSKLGQILNIEMVDTDTYIEEQINEKIADIFAKQGEPVFRAYERKYLKEIPTEDTIVATGGGIVTQKENRDWMKRHGLVVYLHCDFEVIYERLKNDTTRPLFDAEHKEKMKKHFEERLTLYAEADLKIDTTTKTVDQIVDEIIDWLKS